MAYFKVSSLRCNVLFLSIVVIFLAFLSTTSNAADPLANCTREEKTFVMTYLYRYGYMTDPTQSQQRFATNEEKLVEAIKLAQYVNELDMTGTMDTTLMNIMKKPRCAMPDFEPYDDLKKRRKRYSHAIGKSQVEKWNNPLRYKRHNLPSNSELDEDMIDLKLRQAFDMWSEVIPVDFVKAVDDEPAEINIHFEAGQYATNNYGRRFFFDGRGGRFAAAKAVCVGNYSTCQSYNGSIFFDDAEKWSLRFEDITLSAHFLWTAMHELGHVLGLSHSDRHTGAIMNPTPIQERTVLHNDDIRGAQMLHGVRKKSNVTEKPGTIGVAGDIDACTSPVDASFQDRNGDIYFFQERYYWKVDRYGSLFGPYVLQSTWPELKNRVQAAYVRPDGMMVFFKGRRYWVYNGTKLVEERRPITEYGLPLSMKQLDAVLVSPRNGKTYFFKDDLYWRYNEEMKSIEPGYPKNTTKKWEVPTPISAAMTKDYQTFFFRGMKVYTTDYELVRNRPAVKKYWLGSYFLNCTTEDIIKAIHGGTSKTTSGSTLIFVVTIFLLLKL